jgi:hypothetical protein
MKILKNVSLLLFLLSSSISFANPSPQILMRAIGDQSFVIDYKQNGPQEVNISLIDWKGNILLEEIHTEGHFQKKYVMRELPRGHYTIKLQMTDRLIRQPITLEKGHLHLNARNRETIFSPSVMVHDYTVDFSMLNTARKKVKVRLSDEEGSTIYLKGLGNKANLNTRFVLTDFPQGQYTIHTYVEEEEFVHSFELADLFSANQ